MWKTGLGVFYAAPLGKERRTVLIDLGLREWPTLGTARKDNVKNAMCDATTFRIGRNSEGASEGDRRFTDFVGGSHVGIDSIVIGSGRRANDHGEVAKFGPQI